MPGAEETIKLLGCLVPCVLSLATVGGGSFAGELGEPTDVAFKAEIDGTTQNFVQILPKDFDSA